MLMAAGLGTRLRPFTEHMPKPLAPVLSVPCAEFALRALQQIGISQVVANLHHLAGETAAGLRAIQPSIQFTDETAQLLGSGGGIRTALPVLDAMGGSGSFFILNADTLCSLDLRELAATHQRLRTRHGVTMTLALLERSVPGDETYREVLVDSAGDRITGLGAKTSTGRMYVGCAILEREAVAHLEPGVPLEFVERILQPAIERGLAGAHAFSGQWMDVGSPKLWWKTHLELIRQLDAGTIPEAWGRLLRQHNRRLAAGVWSASSAAISKSPAGWNAPAYWDGRGTLPEHLGPSAVLYGEPVSGQMSSGIGAFGQWVACPSTK
jgi:mannose-1-phosphate guanylyltransferase